MKLSVGRDVVEYVYRCRVTEVQEFCVVQDMLEGSDYADVMGFPSR